jgi:hypothetical protein
MMVATMDPQPDEAEIADRIDRSVDQERLRCLWFLRPDYYPTTTAERLRVLGQIERRGDLAAIRTAATSRRWLSPTSSGASDGS